MGRRLILDTNVLIAYERGQSRRPSMDEVDCIASVSLAEYRVGIEMAGTADGAAERARALAAITSVVDVIDYTPAPRPTTAGCSPMYSAGPAHHAAHTT